MGSLAAGGAALLGTGAFEGAYIFGERELVLDVESDDNAYLRLIDTSPYAEYDNGKLKVVIDRLNKHMDTRLDDVFRVQNTTGQDFQLGIKDNSDDSDEEDIVQIFAQPSSGGPVRLDDGSFITLGAGEVVEINIIILLFDDEVLPPDLDTLKFTADGVDSSS